MRLNPEGFFFVLAASGVALRMAGYGLLASDGKSGVAAESSAGASECGFAGMIFLDAVGIWFDQAIGKGDRGIGASFQPCLDKGNGLAWRSTPSVWGGAVGLRCPAAFAEGG